MHELSIATNVVELATEFMRQEKATRVCSVTLRIGELSCVHEDALRFSFDLVAENTPVAGAELKIIAVPISIYCDHCAAIVTLPSIQRFRCPHCDTPSADIRSGREMDLEQIEVD